MPELAIEVRDLVKVYPGRGGLPVRAVDGLDLEVAAGECFGLLGPNGAGKTTTVEILEGLMWPTSGEVRVLGQTWRRHAAALRERIGVTLQETRFPDKVTVLETARIFRSFYPSGLEPAEALRRVSLESKSKAFVETLSGGQQRRLAVAVALVGDPELVFLDEPTTGLDPQSRRQLWDVVGDLQARERTVILTTHYMDEAERLCDRVAIVDHGKVIALGSPSELIAKVGGEHVVEFAVAEDSPPVEPAELAELGELPSVSAVRREVDSIDLTVAAPHAAIPALLDWLEHRGVRLERLTTRQASLEDVFVALTGRHLRDGDASSANGEPPAPPRRRGRRGRQAAG